MHVQLLFKYTQCHNPHSAVTRARNPHVTHLTGTPINESFTFTSTSRFHVVVFFNFIHFHLNYIYSQHELWCTKNLDSLTLDIKLIPFLFFCFIWNAYSSIWTINSIQVFYRTWKVLEFEKCPEKFWKVLGFVNFCEKPWKSPRILHNICPMNFLFQVV